MTRSLLLAAAVACVISSVNAQDKPKKASPAVVELLKSTPQEFIRRYDKNKDGFLSKDELPPRMANAFAKLDANGDGKLDAKEVEQLLVVMRKRFGLDEDAKARAEEAKKDEAADRFVAKLLQAMDRNKDGKISRAEAQGRLADAFDRLDANGDAYLDKSELRKVAAFVASQQGDSGPAAGVRRPAPDFDSLDRNADGRLTRDELRGTPYQKVFDAMDADKDGKVTPREFELYFKKQAGESGSPSAVKKP